MAKFSSFVSYPAQENTGFKIPSILYYTPDGKVRAIGAEAASSAMELEAEDEGLIFVEWYALFRLLRFYSHKGVGSSFI